MSDVLAVFVVVVSSPVRSLLDIRDPFSLTYLVAGFVFAAIVYMSVRRSFGLATLRRFVRHALPRRVVRHRSTRLDLELYVANTMMYTLSVLLLGVSSVYWSGLATGALESLVGASPAFATAWPGWLSALLLTVLLVLAVDLGYWLAHWCCHYVPACWEFHKVHHSAEVMTPLTEWRQHPFELVLFSVSIAVVQGTVHGSLEWFLGKEAQPFTLLQFNAGLLIFFLTFHHLRHSQVWMPVTGVFGRIVHSPAHHHIHHSTKPEHFDKNLGFCLSVWDWVFGTLCIPKRYERIRFGIGEELRELDTLAKCYVTPVRKMWGHALALFGRKSQAGETGSGSG
jgi:sterol desaturase/sphingolipid hydroxylase (fatty acid hydroxylase superfamily)